MASPIEVLVPDIGGFKDVNVIDVLVKDGQQIEKETPLVTIETEKAAMDVPAPVAGKIAQVKLKTGDKVSEGSLILLLEAASAEAAPAGDAAPPATRATQRRRATRQGDCTACTGRRAINCAGRAPRGTGRAARKEGPRGRGAACGRSLRRQRQNLLARQRPRLSTNRPFHGRMPVLQFENSRGNLAQIWAGSKEPA